MHVDCLTVPLSWRMKSTGSRSAHSTLDDASSNTIVLDEPDGRTAVF